MASKIVWNLKAFREIRTSPGVVADIDRRAEAVANAAGEGYEALPAQTPRNRARRIVAPVTPEAARDNEKSNTLIRSLDAAR